MKGAIGSLLALGVFSVLGAIGFSQSEGREFIVTLKDNQSIERINRDHHTTTVRKMPGASVYLLRADDDDRTLKELQKDRGVDIVETNVKLRLNGDVASGGFTGLSTDTMYLLDGRTTTSFYGAEVLQIYAAQPALSIIQADRAREISTGTGARIAYIDTGVDPGHPALRDWVDLGVDLVNGTSASELDGLSTDTMYLLDTDTMYLLDTDTMYLLDHRFTFLLNGSLTSVLNGGPAGAGFPPAFGHGTLVAGVIHAVAPTARIVPIKAFDAYGYTSLAKIVEGVYQAIGMNVDVLNTSFSTGHYSETLRRAIVTAQARGIAVVASVGNEGRNMRDAYPAAFSGVYGVAASDFNDRLAAFSNYGGLVSLTAPGAYVISTVPGGRYAAAWGTSFSAPLVSGAMALRSALLGHGRSEGPLVVNSTDSIDPVNPGFERQLGAGRLNIRQALER